ncbi:MAG: hypothetical protein U0996_10755 [Planctomycetaceae bacterium]
MAAFPNHNSSDLDFRDNPFAAPAVEDVVISREGRMGTGLKIAFSLQLLVLVGGLFASYADVESIVFSGPTYSVAGLIVAVVALSQRRRTLVLMGFSAPVLAVAIFLLIYFNRWNPSDAQFPVPLICTGYFIGILVTTLMMIHRNQTTAELSQPESSLY